MNLQQIPSRGEAKEIRRIFGAGKGNILLSSDFSQQEPEYIGSYISNNIINRFWIQGSLSHIKMIW